MNEYEIDMNNGSENGEDEQIADAEVSAEASVPEEEYIPSEENAVDTKPEPESVTAPQADVAEAVTEVIQPEPVPQPEPARQPEPVREAEPAAQPASYTSTPEQQRPYYQQNPYQYNNPYQYQQPSQGYYRPQTNEYVYAPQPPKKKGNGAKVFFAIVIALLSVFVVSVASISGYMYYQKIHNPEEPPKKIPMEEHEFRNDPEDQDVDIAPENENEDDEREDVTSTSAPFRGFPTLEQLATPDDAMSIPDIYDKVSPSVVGVSCYVHGGTQTGTGFIISEDGYIVTNAHVIDGHISVMIVDEDMNEFEAEVIGSDSQTDIAVLKIDPSGKNLVAVEFGRSSELRIGELAIAIGNPLGFDLYGTMTTGIISGLNRSVTIGDNNMTLLQTSASINRGNSGGPLIDAYGRVIGITSAKIDSTYGESLGFAIPIDEAIPIVENLMEYGYVVGRPSIGISGRDINEMLSLFWRKPQGVLVQVVTEGSGAQVAGIEPGDIIIGIEGETITNMSELNAIKNQFSVGDTVTLTIYRTMTSDWGGSEGKSFDVDVVLTEATPAPQ